MRAGAEIFHTLRGILKKKGHSTGVGDEGGFAPSLSSNREAVDVVLEAVVQAGYKPGDNVYRRARRRLERAVERRRRSTTSSRSPATRRARPTRWSRIYEDWVRQYPIISIEDGLAEGDWDGWKTLTKALGDRVQLVGDDVFVTNPEILARGIEEGIGNALLVKLNQIGTVTETLDAVAMARDAGYHSVISHRSGETEDTTIADLAVAHQRRPDQDGLGQPHRSRREVQPAAANRRRARHGGPLRRQERRQAAQVAMAPTRPLVLIVLDGWGIRADPTNNAIALARTPVYDALVARYPHAQLITSGEAVGLPAGQMGNSEVGHMNMGAGRIVYQDLTRIDKSISDGELFESPALAASMDRCAGEHARAALHRPRSPTAASTATSATCTRCSRWRPAAVSRACSSTSSPTAATPRRPAACAIHPASSRRSSTGRRPAASRRSCGRYYAMDRDKRWERTKLAYDAMINGAARRQTAHGAAAADPGLARGRRHRRFIKPIVIVGADGQPIGPIRDGDSVVFFNFRADRARQLTRAIALDDFDGFERPDRPRVHYTTMTVYDRTFNLPVVFTPQTFSGNLADVLAEHAPHEPPARRNREVRARHLLLQLRPRGAVSGRGPDPGAVAEGRDLRPEAGDERPGNRGRARRGRDQAGKPSKSSSATSPTPTWSATPATWPPRSRRSRRSTAASDASLAALKAVGGRAIVTADHGNAEQMWDDELKAPHTAHTSNPVPVVLCADELVGTASAGRLAAGRCADHPGTAGDTALTRDDGQHPARVGNLARKRDGPPGNAGGPCESVFDRPPLGAAKDYSTSFSCVSSAAIRSDRRNRLSFALISKLRRSPPARPSEEPDQSSPARRVSPGS